MVAGLVLVDASGAFSTAKAPAQRAHARVQCYAPKKGGSKHESTTDTDEWGGGEVFGTSQDLPVAHFSEGVEQVSKLVVMV